MQAAKLQKKIRLRKFYTTFIYNFCTVNNFFNLYEIKVIVFHFFVLSLPTKSNNSK